MENEPVPAIPVAQRAPPRTPLFVWIIVVIALSLFIFVALPCMVGMLMTAWEVNHRYDAFKEKSSPVPPIAPPAKEWKP